MNKKIYAFAALLALTSCAGQKWQQQTKDGYILITQKGGRSIGYSPESGVQILTVNGYAFKDLNRNGQLDPYEDWRLPAGERAKDLAAQLSIEEIAGLMLYSGHQAIPGGAMSRGTGSSAGNLYGGVPYAESGAKPYDMSDAQKKFLKEDNLRHVLVTTVESPEVAARWNNNVQAYVESFGHGIPANNSSDPRHGASVTGEFDAGNGGTISQWPSSLGMAATFDPALVEKFGKIAAEEYRALGIATALSPQIDLATEPRWSRFNGTFGEDPKLDEDMARAYVDGFQTSTGADEIKDGWGYKSVNAMIKHWPSGGPEEGGRDAHFCYGKYSVFPGKNFEMHMKPFVEGAMNLNGGTGSASAVMPYYTISYDFGGVENRVGNSYSKYIITDLLRERFGYDGVVCTDWMITFDNPAVDNFGGMCWGKELESVAQRHFDVICAGVDQFGGNNDKGPVLEAYQMYIDQFGKEAADARFQNSARRLLLNIFRVGLFENPYLDPVQSAEVVGKPEFMAAGYDAQLKSVVMLKNHANALPVAAGTKVYIPKKFVTGGVARTGLAATAAVNEWREAVAKSVLDRFKDVTFVDSAADADIALCFISEPSTGSGYSRADVAKGGNGYVPVSLQYSDYTAVDAREVSLAGGDPKESFTNRSYKNKSTVASNKSDMELVINTKKQMGDKPVVAIVTVGRPMVMAEIEPYADAILISFGVQQQAILDVITGASEPSGLLPMQMPANMKTVEEQFEDVPRDMQCHVDADGNSYDFAFGLNWSGVINDERVQKYK
ncbi:MAG: glycoside hydrolase family 3 C-terminal domain-containing protein [Bacteroidales bacterium]|nr:glycoside hydrolase family 3 C-terminal domain-containing protein [Bacteroidales bacterium]